MNRSSIRTLLKRSKVKVPKNHVHWTNTPNGRESLVRWNKTNFMKSQGTAFIINDRYYRLRKEGDAWFADVSCELGNFDRWSNSRFYDSVPLELFVEFCNKCLINKTHNIEELQKELFRDYVGSDNPLSWVNVRSENEQIDDGSG